MAIAVIGGLITSTLLSLLVVPAVFTYIDDAQTVIGKLARRLGLLKHRHGGTQATPQPASA